jgi:hypothetical protein
VNATSLSGLRRWLPVLLIGLAPALARAETVLVAPATGAGVSSEIVRSARALFINRLSRQETRLLIIDHDRPPTPEPLLPENALLMGMQARAEAVILVDLRRSDGATTLKVTGLGIPRGERLFEYRQATAAGPEVIPALVDAAVVAALTRRGSDRPVTIFSGPRMTFFGARAGVRVPRETAGDTDTALLGMGLFVVKNFSRLFVDIGFTINSADRGDNDDRGNVTAFGLGAYLPFVAEANAPYLGASLRWQHSRFGGQGADGFVVTPSLGWSWRQKDSLGLRIEGGVFYNLYEERGLDRLIPGSTAAHRSYGLDLWLVTWI